MPVLGEVIRVLETPETERHYLWLNQKFPNAEAPLKDFVAECWLDAAGLLRRNRTEQRGRKRTQAPTTAAVNGVLCVPEGLRRAVLSLHHDHTHAGVAALSDAIGRIYWWPTLSSDCKVFVDMCHVCKSVRTSTTKMAEATGMGPRARIPGEQYVFDMLGPLPETTEGYKYLR